MPNAAAKLYETDTTIRSVVHLSLGGVSIRIIFTNEYGADPLKIGSASVALPGSSLDTVRPETAHAVLFSGQPSVEIPANSIVLSDPIPMPMAPLSDVSVSYFIPGQHLSGVTEHPGAVATSYVAPENQIQATTLKNAQPLLQWHFLRNVEVAAADNAAAVVAFGDSIVEGAASTRDANARWSNVLSSRLQADRKLSHLGVINEGIGGNRVLHPFFSALYRFNADVIAQDGVKYLILCEGVNDIGRTGKPIRPNEEVTAELLIAAYKQIIARAHAHGIKVIGGTLTPFEGADYYTPAGEEMRQAVNQFIRTSGRFDGVVDFDKAVADPKHPTRLNPDFNLRDKLHPNDAGYKAMGNAIDLNLFR